MGHSEMTLMCIVAAAGGRDNREASKVHARAQWGAHRAPRVLRPEYRNLQLAMLPPAAGVILRISRARLNQFARALASMCYFADVRNRAKLLLCQVDWRPGTELQMPFQHCRRQACRPYKRGTVPRQSA